MRPSLAHLVLALALLGPCARISMAQDGADSTRAEPVRLGLDAEVGLSVFEDEIGDRERFFSAVLMPEFRRGLWQAGLMLKLRHNGSGFRKEDYDEARDFLSFIRFVQYAEKGADGSYVRVGDLEEARIGYGQVINDYANTLSLDRPRVGVEYDYDWGPYRLESFISDIWGVGTYGVRGALRPYLDEEGSRRRHAVFGVSLAGDVTRDARLVNPASPGTAFIVDPEAETIDSLGVVRAVRDTRPVFVSIDAGLPISTTSTDELLGYVTLTKMLNHGAGLGVGAEARRAVGESRIEVRLEQRVSFGEYLPSYFNALYEANRLRDFSVSLEDGTVIEASNSKQNRVSDRSGAEFGSFVQFNYRYGRAFRLKTSYEHAWNRSASGWFRLDLRFRHPDLLYVGRFTYDVVNVGSFGDITSGPSDDSLLRIAFAYRFWEHLLLGAHVRQSFEPRERNGRIVGQSKRTRFEPYIMLRI